MSARDILGDAVSSVQPLPYDHSVVDWLVAQHGPLLSHSALAEILDRDPGSLRDCLSRYPQRRPYAIIRAARRQIGRRVCYDARVIARVIAGDQP